MGRNLVLRQRLGHDGGVAFSLRYQSASTRSGWLLLLRIMKFAGAPSSQLHVGVMNRWIDRSEAPVRTCFLFLLLSW